MFPAFAVDHKRTDTSFAHNFYTILKYKGAKKLNKKSNLSASHIKVCGVHL